MPASIAYASVGSSVPTQSSSLAAERRRKVSMIGFRARAAAACLAGSILESCLVFGSAITT